MNTTPSGKNPASAQNRPNATSPGSSAQAHSAAATTKPDTVMCILSYLGIFSLIPFFAKKDDPYISWHARQGVLLAVVSFAIYAVLFVVTLIPVLGLLMLPVFAVFGLGVLGLSIWCMVQACKGNRWPIPVLSNFVGRVPG